MRNQAETLPVRGEPEAGFTLIEALVAIVVLIFGLIAVTNLFIVAASSTAVANHSTASTAMASLVMDRLKSTQYVGGLNPGGVINSPPLPPAVQCAVAVAGDFSCFEDVPGVERVIVQWQIQPVLTTTRAVIIRVRAEGANQLTGSRSRAEFTTFRSCTDTAATPPCPAGP